ncbi:etoposide-induced protein 2.4 homolog isoform X1 [Argonauta hians]
MMPPNALQVIFGGVLQGLCDSLRGTIKFYKICVESSQKEKEKKKKKNTEPSLMKNILTCCVWNGGVFLASILGFNYILLPIVQKIIKIIFGKTVYDGVVWLWIYQILSWTFNTLWVLPLFMVSKIVNCFWFQDIADQAYKTTRGRPRALPFSTMVADTCFSVLLHLIFLIQSMLASLIPIQGVGFFIGLLHMALLSSSYAFEYRWFNMGLEVHQRVACVEKNWPYYFGFGLPLALCTLMFTSQLVSGCVFSLLFPLFIISANEAEVKQSDIYSPFMLKLFTPSAKLTNLIFCFLTNPRTS